MVTVNTVNVYDCTRHFFADRTASLFNAPVQTVNVCNRSKHFAAASSLGQIKIFSFKDCIPPANGGQNIEKQSFIETETMGQVIMDSESYQYRSSHFSIHDTEY